MNITPMKTMVKIFGVLISFTLVCACAERSSSSRSVPGATAGQESAQAERFLTTTPEPVEIHRPTPDQWTLGNGLRVLFLRDDELPVVSGSLFLRGGTLYEAEDSLGVIATMGQMLRFGGTKQLPPEALDEKLRELAAEISSGFSGEYGKISFNALSSDFPVLSIFHDIVLAPRFDEERLEIIRTQSLESIRRRKDDPVTVSRITANYLLYGKSAYGGIVETSDVQQLSRINLLRAHREFIRPDGATFVITGNVSRSEVEKTIGQLFAGWPARGSLLDPPPAPPKPSPAGVYVISGDYSQANINAVQSGPDRHSKDRYAISLLNNIVGDGLDSRLTKNIRADLGLAYTVYGVIIPGYKQGKNLLYIQTKSESTHKALAEAFRQLTLIQREPPGAQELDVMQQAAQSSFVFRFTSPGQILERTVLLELFGYPDDYDETYLKRIFSVTPTKISRVAERWWQLDDFRVVVVGSPEAIAHIEEGRKNHPLLSRHPLYKMSFDEIPKKAS